MSLCFIEPQDAIRIIAESVGREARRQLLSELVRAWVDEIPDEELASHYAKAVADLDEHDLSMLAAWHASMEVGMPVANKDFLVAAFGSLGENRREALRVRTAEHESARLLIAARRDVPPTVHGLGTGGLARPRPAVHPAVDVVSDSPGSHTSSDHA